MGHLAFTHSGKIRKGTPDAWLPVAAQIARFARKLSGRNDIVANVGPGIGGQYATACWSPLLADMEVNTDTCLPGYAPDRVDFDDEVFRLGALPFVGAVTHEAAHAAWTCWTPYDLIQRSKAGREPWNRATTEIVIALEESRIERLAMMQHPENRDALAQCALSIVLKDFKVNNTLYGASLSLALTVGRYPILSVEEIDRFRSLVEPHLPLGLMARLEALIREYHGMPIRLAKSRDLAMNDADYARMYDIADRWLIAIRETAAALEAARLREEAREEARRERAERKERERAETEAAEDDEPAEDVESEDADEATDESGPGDETETETETATATDDPAEPEGTSEPADEDGVDEDAAEPAEPAEPAEAVEAERPSEDMESGEATEAPTMGESGPESDDTDADDESDPDDAEGAPEPSEGSDDDDDDDDDDDEDAPAESAGESGSDDADDAMGDLEDNSGIEHGYDEEPDEDEDYDEPEMSTRNPREEQPDLRSGIPGEDEEGQVVVVIVFDEGEEPAAEEPGKDDDLGEEIRKAAGAAAMDREADALDERAEKVAERKVEDRAADAARRGLSGAMMDARHGSGAHGFSEFCGSHKRAPRAPQPGERIAANRLASELEKITFHDRAVTKVDRVIPGGKLRPRAAVAKAADRSRGGRAEIPVWRAKERRHTAETPIRIGVMTDVSGSMSDNEEPSAVLTYVLSQAVSQIDGQVATSVFGARGFLVNRAHERTTQVQRWAASDGFEAFKESALLIDAELNILDGDGARILVIFTDGHFVNATHREYASTFMRLCKQKNVAVVWCSYQETPISNYGHGAVLDLSGSAADIANTLGAAILKEVSKVEASRGA